MCYFDELAEIDHFLEYVSEEVIPTYDHSNTRNVDKPHELQVSVIKENELLKYFFILIELELTVEI